MFEIKKSGNHYFILSEGTYSVSPNGNDLKSTDGDLVQKVVDFVNDNGLPELGEVNIYNLFLTLVDNYPDGHSGGKAHLRKQLWRDPVFHDAASKELQDPRKHAIELVKPWFEKNTNSTLPVLEIEELWEDEEEETIFYPKEELQEQWVDYLKIVNAVEAIYDGMTLRQKTIIACLTQTFDAFHLCLYLMFVTGEITAEDLADILFVAYDLPMEALGNIGEGEANDDRQLNLEEFTVFNAFINL